MPKTAQNLLSAVAVKNAKPGRHSDGGGLYLNVRKGHGSPKALSRAWLFRWRDKARDGRLRDLGLGSTSTVTLAEAREMAGRLRKAVAEGRDPVAERDGAGDAEEPEPALTFEAAARQVHAEQRTGWKNGKHQDQWINTLQLYAFPKIGHRPVDEIASGEVKEVLMPIWNTKPETARRVRQRMRLTFDWAIACQHRDKANPVDALRAAMPRQAAKKRHFAAMPYAEVPAVLLTLRGNEKANLRVKLALEFLILTAARTGEVIGARWSEIDRESATWTVPADRMKAGREHRVPLCDRCLEILDEAETMRSAHDVDDGLLFPGRNWRSPMSNMSLTMTLRRMGHDDVTVHGFRSSFRDWAADRTATPRDVCEAALAHTVRDRVEAAYRRTDHFDARRLLMNEWAAFLASGEAKVVTLRAACG
ncbi:MAG: integrase arm-type DNA-binding domain-containing protein [Pseudomonadota bacterium]